MRNPFRRKALTATPEAIEAIRSGSGSTYVRLGGTNQQVQAAWMQAQSATYAGMYQSQPAVRSVVDFIARNVAQLGLKCYERVSDTERQRDEDHAAARTMREPNPSTTGDKWIFKFVADKLVYDNAYAIKFRGPGDRRTLVIVPAHMVAVLGSARFVVDGYRVWRSDGTFIDVPPEDMIHWSGYDPMDPRLGYSKLETLRKTLAEEAAAQQAAVELSKSGLQAPGHIKRPAEAPDWSEDARERFQSSWANRVKAGSRETPVLEEGMEFVEGKITPRAAQLLESRRFTVEEVARLYGVPSGALSLEPSNDLQEQRRQVYADVLPPICEELASQLDASLLRAEYAADEHYFEFDLNEKMRGDVENRFAALTSSAGRPWLTVNEVRARENLPPIDGGDALTIPLNVMLEGEESPALPAPNVMPPQDPNKPLADGSFRPDGETRILPAGKAVAGSRRKAVLARREAYRHELEELIEKFYDRQQRTVTARKGAVSSGEGPALAPRFRMKDFDTGRWDKELTNDLDKTLARIVEREGDITAQRLALLAFDSSVTKNYIREWSERVAKETNRKTATTLVDKEPKEAFDSRRGDSSVWAVGLATGAMRFAMIEAGKQAPGKRVKTWVVVSDDSAHPELDGETVAVEDSFSNGAMGPPADHANCQCLMEVT